MLLKRLCWIFRRAFCIPYMLCKHLLRCRDNSIVHMAGYRTASGWGHLYRNGARQIEIKLWNKCPSSAQGTPLRECRHSYMGSEINESLMQKNGIVNVWLRTLRHVIYEAHITGILDCPNHAWMQSVIQTRVQGLLWLLSYFSKQYEK